MPFWDLWALAYLIRDSEEGLGLATRAL
jgi:hypothetical protein